MTRRDEDIQAQYYTQTAADYDAIHVAQDDEHAAALRHISAFVDILGIRSVLDVGCGTGRAVKYFISRHPNVQVKGVEPVAALLEQAVQIHRIPAEQLIEGRGESLPFADGSFDAVCAFGVLHHVRRPAGVVGQMMRVARKAVFISDANRFGQGGGLERITKLLLYRCGLWGAANFVKTGGKGYLMSEEDGLAYSYSVYDSYSQVARWAERMILIPTGKTVGRSWLDPLLTSSHVLMCGLRESVSIQESPR